MKHTTLTRVGVALIVTPLLVLGAHYANELLMVRNCLDAGGSFDYAAMSCSFTRAADYVPYSVRYRWNLNIALGVSLLGLLLSALGGRRRRAGRLGSYS